MAAQRKLVLFYELGLGAWLELVSWWCVVHCKRPTLLLRSTPVWKRRRIFIDVHVDVLSHSWTFFFRHRCRRCWGNWPLENGSLRLSSWVLSRRRATSEVAVWRGASWERCLPVVCVCGGRKKMLTNLYGACGVVSFIIICELFNIFIANDNQIGNWRVFDERRLKCRFWVFVRSKGGGITRVACKFFFIEQWRLQRWLF